jgi:tetratricopeptide (TPR) repeat protein
MKPHAFVAMPFGNKPGPDGQAIDFNRVYEEYLKPGIEGAGLEVFRADEEQRAGDILTDMFQELLIADLVVADLTIDNPNVWYELGVRHALRARGVILVCGGHTTKAFDVYTNRKLRYNLKGNGPDPDTLTDDLTALTSMVRETMNSWHGRKISPVYQLMPNLQEPDWKSLRMAEGGIPEFWARYENWELRLESARKGDRIGNMLLLADEAPVAAFRAEAWIDSGIALLKAKHYDFALEQIERGLEVAPGNLQGLQKKGVCLQRLDQMGKLGDAEIHAREHYQSVLQNHPDDAETWALLGRVDKDAWTDSWETYKTTEERRSEAGYEDALLRSAIKSYLTGYRKDPRHYYSGINALTLMHLYTDLTEDNTFSEDMPMLAGAVRFAARNKGKSYWPLVTLGDLEVLTGSPAEIKKAYKEAIANNERNWFALDSSRAQLIMLQNLGFRPEHVSAGLETFQKALDKLDKPEDDWQPERVFLFSGHMVDTQERINSRFPPEPEFVNTAAAAIADRLKALNAGEHDLAITQGACGGDLLFTEACLDLGVKVRWLQPFDEPDFIQRSVVRGGEQWRERYQRAREQLDEPPGSAPQELGDPPTEQNNYPYERCNQWLLYTAMSYGLESLNFICLWDGGGGDGPGGTAHMCDVVRKHTGKVEWIKTTELFRQITS